MGQSAIEFDGLGVALFLLEVFGGEEDVGRVGIEERTGGDLRRDAPGEGEQAEQPIGLLDAIDGIESVCDHAPGDVGGQRRGSQILLQGFEPPEPPGEVVRVGIAILGPSVTEPAGGVGPSVVHGDLDGRVEEPGDCRRLLLSVEPLLEGVGVGGPDFRRSVVGVFDRGAEEPLERCASVGVIGPGLGLGPPDRGGRRGVQHEEDAEDPGVKAAGGTAGRCGVSFGHGCSTAFGDSAFPRQRRRER